MISGQLTFADIIERNTKYLEKPGWIVIPKGHIWCPYCNWVHRFKYDARLGVHRCINCGISERDYYIKKFNGLGEFDEMLRKHLHRQ